MSDFTRRVDFTPGYQRRTEGFGVHGMEIRFVLHGAEGATQFMVNTGWVPGEPMSPTVAGVFPMAWDLGYHWPTPHYEDQAGFADCDILGEGGCYYDGSSLNAGPVLARFIAEGEAAVWTALEDYYVSLCGRQAVAP